MAQTTPNASFGPLFVGQNTETSMVPQNNVSVSDTVGERAPGGAPHGGHEANAKRKKKKALQSSPVTDTN